MKQLKINYLLNRYVNAFNKNIFIETKDTKQKRKILNLDSLDNLNDFELQHFLEKKFYNNSYEIINFDNVLPKRQEIVLKAYILSYSNLKFLLNDKVEIKTIQILNNSKLNLKQIQILALCEVIAKDLTNLPPNYLQPKDFYAFIIIILKQLGVLGKIGIKKYEEDEFASEQFYLIDAIAKSNNDKNYIIELSYENEENENNNIHIIGKGVCYDSGGYSLKTNNSMRTMKGDMGGAANTFAIFLGNLLLEASNMKIYLGLVLNLITNPSLLPDQVIKTRDDVLVEITNTDSEGRLIIGDLISYANSKIEEGDEIMVFATLTDIAKSMGRYVNSCFSNNLSYVSKISNSALQENEYVWPLPLDQFNNIYGKELEKSSEIANIANSNLNNLEANSIYAANFGYYFLKNKTNKFIHFDIGSTGWRNQKAHAPLVKSIIRYSISKKGGNNGK